MKQIGLVLILLALVACMIAAASVTDNVARTNEYQAFVEMGRAMQVSSAGNLASITILGGIAALLLVVVVILLVALLRRGSNRPGKQHNSARTTGAEQLPGRMDPMMALAMTMLLQQQRQQQRLPGQNNTPALYTGSVPDQTPVDAFDINEDVEAPWWG